MGWGGIGRMLMGVWWGTWLGIVRIERKGFEGV